MKKILISIIAGLALTACSQDANTASAPKSVISSESCITAALTYADWCSSCKILDPKLTEAKSALNDTPISYVTLDYTAKDGEAMFAAADAAGIGPAIRSYLSEEIFTGLLLVVDTTKGEVVGRINKTFTPAQITDSLKMAAQSCASPVTKAPETTERQGGYGS